GAVTSTWSRSPVTKETAGVEIEAELSVTDGPVMLTVADPRNEPATGRSARIEYTLAWGVESFDPVAPATACTTSACSSVAEFVAPDARSRRSIIPAGGMNVVFEVLIELTTSMSPGCVVVMLAGVPLPPVSMSIGVVVSTFAYALMPPAELRALLKLHV